MSEEFEGNVPNINVFDIDKRYFTYTCGDTEQILKSPCAERTPLSDKCFECIGFNRRFAKYFKDSRHCSCGYKIDFGYFLLIFHFDKAGLLPNDFRIMCCSCHRREQLREICISYPEEE